MPAGFDRRQFLQYALSGMAASAGCRLERKQDSTGSASGPAAGSASAIDPSAAPKGGIDPVLVRATEWLWNRQTVPTTIDRFRVPAPRAGEPSLFGGGWHSTTYAQLKSGRSLTPLVVWALRQAGVFYDRDPVHSFSAEISLREWINVEGALGTDDPGFPEYPNYATSLALRHLSGLDREENGEFVARMTKYLVDQQYREANGFGPEHVAYGGWGFGGKLPIGGSPGHMDLAHTRHVLEALRAAGHDEAATYRRAERFLRLVQKHPTEDREQPTLRAEAPSGRVPYDGGFYFSPVVLAANKAGEAVHEGRPYFRSYATATCEGILALLACGVKRDDERIRAAVGWLLKHPRLDYPEGIPEDQHENWGASIRYYHFAVRSQCYAALNWPGDWRTEMRDLIAKRQEPDGSFVNREGILMKEDDPILCTALAVLALGYARKE